MGSWFRRVPLCLLFGAAWIPAHVQAQSGAWALTNAKIETVTKGTIGRGTIIIRDGVIESVGANAAIPADARVMDLANRTVYPGFIDLTSTIGLPPVQNRPAGNPFQGAAPDTTQRNIGLEPNRLVANELSPASADVRAARDRGITTALVAPDRGVFRGLSAMIPLRDDTATGSAARGIRAGQRPIPRFTAGGDRLPASGVVRRTATRPACRPVPHDGSWPGSAVVRRGSRCTRAGGAG